MKICVISDTHNKHKYLTNQLPEAEMIIHCGDFTSVGKEHEVINFMKWYSNLKQFKYKLIIAGNHDKIFEYNSLLAKSLIPNNVIYLEDSGIEIEDLYFYGTPVSKPFNNWGFNRPEEKLIEYYNAIPENTNILITHNPPYSIFDYVEYNMEHIGSPSLYKNIIERVHPILNLFGHNHGGRGFKIIENTIFINATNLNDDYICVHEPILIEIIDKKVEIIKF